MTFAMIGWQEALPIVAIVVILFGAKKLPELGRSLGQGIKEFKHASKNLMGDDEEDKKTEPPSEENA
ncbi:MAG: twin-arginine translocase TatA/TatE family subunit [Armatimonadota bacterium]|nr:twin-arginine translocase TatA/TatE family subunit [Armatimonadota bacterium]